MENLKPRSGEGDFLFNFDTPTSAFVTIFVTFACAFPVVVLLGLLVRAVLLRLERTRPELCQKLHDWSIHSLLSMHKSSVCPQCFAYRQARRARQTNHDAAANSNNNNDAGTNNDENDATLNNNRNVRLNESQRTSVDTAQDTEDESTGEEQEGAIPLQHIGPIALPPAVFMQFHPM